MAINQTERAPENKGGELTDAFSTFMTSFESFKQANDERLAQLETRSGADVLTTEKVDRISRALDEQKRALDALTMKGLRPGLGGAGLVQPDEHKEAFEAYMRSGDDRQIRALDTKAMSYGSGQDGGYLVPAQTEAEVGKRLAGLSPIRSIAAVRQVSAAVLKKPFAVGGPAVGWVAETAARPQTNTPTLAELQFPTMELYAMPAATSALLEDSVVDLDQWIASEVDAAFAAQEGAAFVNGDGTNKPRGLLNYDQVAESAWEWGKVTAVTFYDADGVAHVLSAGDYQVDTVSRPARVVIGKALDGLRAMNGLEIDFACGFGEAGPDVPDILRRAITLLAAHWYEFRTSYGPSDQPVSYPAGYDRMISAYVERRL